MGLMFPICGQVSDVDGIKWDVRDVRTTKHGFDLHFGTPARNHGAYRGGMPRLIATPALRDYWERTIGQIGTTFDLPAGRTTLKRVRYRLGFHWHHDADEYYAERADDLANLSDYEFVLKHGRGAGAIGQRRLQILGPRARKLGWWRTPRIIKLLLSKRTLREIGEELGIGTTHSMRLRRLAAELSMREKMAEVLQLEAGYDELCAPV